jgi:hypothetical protein
MDLYSHAGVSRKNGVMKVRFANDAFRIKVLAKNGHKDIDLVELKTPMTKAAIVEFLLKSNWANGNADVQTALEEAADKRGVTIPGAKVVTPSPKEVKTPAKTKVKAAPKKAAVVKKEAVAKTASVKDETPVAETSVVNNIETPVADLANIPAFLVRK